MNVLFLAGSVVGAAAPACRFDAMMMLEQEVKAATLTRAFRSTSTCWQHVRLTFYPTFSPPAILTSSRRLPQLPQRAISLGITFLPHLASPHSIMSKTVVVTGESSCFLGYFS